MKAINISMALAALALVSTGAANAQCADQCGAYSVGAPVAIQSNNYCGTGTPVSLQSDNYCSSGRFRNFMNPRDGWFNVSVLGAGLNVGGRNGYQTCGAPLLGTGCTTQTTEFSRLIPRQLGNATPVCGERIGNRMLHLDVFGMRLFGAGIVNPRWDMRPNGSAN